MNAFKGQKQEKVLICKAYLGINVPSIVCFLAMLFLLRKERQLAKRRSTWIRGGVKGGGDVVDTRRVVVKGW
ncbi:unnamed protein product [Meloidogyne enterolobii]|uniref:Uncharacterized protein n=1 Tax=Meloidogyne enterolobii TaxID=390850 RepID=A0ACB0XMA6_MELEN